MGEFLRENALELIQSASAVVAAGLALWSILTARKIAADSHFFTKENQEMIEASDQRRAHAATISALDEAIHSLLLHTVNQKRLVRELHRRHVSMGKPATTTSIDYIRIQTTNECNELGQKLQSLKDDLTKKGGSDIADWRIEEIKALDFIRDVKYLSRNQEMMIEDVNNELNYIA